MFSVYLLALRRVQNLNEVDGSSQLFPTVQKMKLKHLEYDEGPRQRGQSLNKNQTKHLSVVQLINSSIFFPNGRVLLYPLKPSAPELHLTPWPAFIMTGQ